MSVSKILGLGILSGCHIGFGAFLMLSVGGACPGLAASNPGLQKILLGAFGLVRARAQLFCPGMARIQATGACHAYWPQVHGLLSVLSYTSRTAIQSRCPDLAWTDLGLANLRNLHLGLPSLAFPRLTVCAQPFGLFMTLMTGAELFTGNTALVSHLPTYFLTCSVHRHTPRLSRATRLPC